MYSFSDMLMSSTAVAVVPGDINYWGTGGDGALSTTGNVSLTATTDGEMVVMNYSSLTINAGHTLTVANRCRGLLIYVNGDCTINGTLTMTARGASADPVALGVSAAGLQIWRRTASGSATYISGGLAGAGTAAVNAETNQINRAGSATVFTIARTGANGGAGVSNSAGGAGAAGATGQSGGGGAGGGAAGNPGTGGRGGIGTCFSGGPGGGSGDGGTGGAGSDTGGAGGAGQGPNNQGGVGNPGGTGNQVASNSGTGGLLILIVRGTLTVGSAGVISADGVGNIAGGDRAGGSSGGGNVLVLYGNAYSNAGSVRANGGPATGSGGGAGGAGGAGSVQVAKVDNGTITGPVTPPSGYRYYRLRAIDQNWNATFNWGTYGVGLYESTNWTGTDVALASQGTTASTSTGGAGAVSLNDGGMNGGSYAETGPTNGPGFFQFDLGASRRATVQSFQFSVDGSYHARGYPRAFVLERSNDAATWELSGVYTTPPDTSGTSSMFFTTSAFRTSQSVPRYRFYRIRAVKPTWAGGNAWWLMEIRLFTGPDATGTNIAVYKPVTQRVGGSTPAYSMNSKDYWIVTDNETMVSTDTNHTDKGLYWWYIDVGVSDGAAYDVKSVQLQMQSYDNYLPQAFCLDGSADANSWTVIQQFNTTNPGTALVNPTFNFNVAPPLQTTGLNTAVAHTYWRLRATDVCWSGDWSWWIAELAMYASADWTGPNVAINTAEVAVEGVSNPDVINNNALGGAAGNGSTTAPQWFGINFGTNGPGWQAVNSFILTSHQSYPQNIPKSFDLESSSDGITWFKRRSYTVPVQPPSDGAAHDFYYSYTPPKWRYYRVYNPNLSWGNQWDLALGELQFFTSTDGSGTPISNGATGIGPSGAASLTALNDGNTTTVATSLVSATNTNAWLGYDFGVGADVVPQSVKITFDNTTRYPRTLLVQRSEDGVNWDTLRAYDTAVAEQNTTITMASLPTNVRPAATVIDAALRGDANINIATLWYSTFRAAAWWNTTSTYNAHFTNPKTTGKYYIEGSDNYSDWNQIYGIAVSGSSLTADARSSAGYVVLDSKDGKVYVNGAYSGLTTTPGTGGFHRLGIAIDLDNKKIYFKRYGVWYGDPVAGTGGTSFSGLSGPFRLMMAGGNTPGLALERNIQAGTPPTGYGYWN